MALAEIEKKIMEVIVLVRAFLYSRKVGNIQINMFQGGISSVNVNETLKLNK